MDGRLFDQLTQRFGQPGSRRVMIRGVAAAVAAATGLTSLDPAAAARCRPRGRRCRRGADCCSRRCGRQTCRKGPSGRGCRRAKRRVCLPGVAGRTCRRNNDCRSGVCACGAAGGRSCWGPGWSQNFDQNLNGWYDLHSRPGAGPVGILEPASHAIQRRPVNNVPIPPASGAFAGQVFGPVDALTNNAVSALTLWGGARPTLPAGGYTVSLDVYIDPVPPADPNARYVFAVAGSDPDNCQPTNPVYFRAGNDANNPDFFCLSIVDSDPTGSPCLAPQVIFIERIPGNRGWYTFVTEFYASTANLQMVARAYARPPSGGGTPPETFVIPGGYGGNHAGWFPYIAGYDAVFIDNAVRTTGGVTPD